MKEVDIRLKKEGGERRERIGDKGSGEREEEYL
jgi:hypothetical protein